MRCVVRNACVLSKPASTCGRHTIARTHTNIAAPAATSSADNYVKVAPQTAIVMLNMGGPSSLEGAHDGVEAFLHRLFMDNEIISLGPLQRWLVSFPDRRTAHT